MEEFKSGRTSRRHSAALLGQGLNVGQDVLESQRDAEPRLLRNILLISSARVGSSLGPSCMWPAVEPQGASSPSQGSQAVVAAQPEVLRISVLIPGLVIHMHLGVKQ